MCGLYGWQWNKAKLPRAEKRSILAVVLGSQNDNRGGDSYGWVDTNTFRVKKGLGLVSPVADEAAWSTGLIAHTRYATTGEKTIPNAHPFEFGKVIGAHNGIISNHREMNTKYDRKFEVDSMHIFANLADGKGVDELTGYGAVTFVLKDQPGKTFLCRMNDSGKLHVAETENGVIWSSDPDHLEIAIAAARLKMVQDYKVDTSKIHFVEDGKLYVTKNEMKLKEWTSSTYATSGGRNYSSSHFQNTVTHRTPAEEAEYKDYLASPERTMEAYRARKAKERAELAIANARSTVKKLGKNVVINGKASELFLEAGTDQTTDTNVAGANSADSATSSDSSGEMSDEMVALQNFQQEVLDRETAKEIELSAAEKNAVIMSSYKEARADFTGFGEELTLAEYLEMVRDQEAERQELLALQADEKKDQRLSVAKTSCDYCGEDLHDGICSKLVSHECDGHNEIYGFGN